MLFQAGRRSDVERHRRDLIARSVVAALIAFVIGAGAAHVLLMPRLVRREIVRAAARRGLEIQTGRISIRGTWVRIEDVTICTSGCGDVDPLVMKVEMLRVKPSLGAILRGRISGSTVDLSGVRARVDLSIPGSMERLESLRRRGKEASRAENPAAPGAAEESRGGFPVNLRGDRIDVDVTLPGGIRFDVRGGRIMPGSRESPPSIDLGAVDAEMGGISLTTRHLLVELSRPGDAGLVRSVRLVSPEVSIGQASGEESAGGQTMPEAAEGPVQGGDAGERFPDLAALVEKAIGKARLPERVLAIFPDPVVEWNGGRLAIVRSGGAEGFTLSKLKGRISAGPDGVVDRIVASGDVESGPFTAVIDVESDKVIFDVETPYVPARDLVGLIGSGHGKLDLEEARIFIDCRGSIDRGKGSLVIDGIVGGDGLTIESERLALEPVSNVHFRLDGHLEFDPEAMTVAVGDSTLDASGIPLEIAEASIEKLPDGYRISARGLLVPTSCQALFDALPFEMRSSLPGFRFAGELGSGFEVNLDWSHPDDAVLDFQVDNRCSVVSGGDLALDKFGHAFLHSVKDKLGEHEFVMGPGTDSWVNMEEIAPHMPQAIVTTEDGAFYKHAGISMPAIKRAAIKNMKAGHFAFGASTITMQLVKNLFLTRDKTISRKLQEMILTWWVENSMEKDQILELYLNVVEFGPAIYGIRAASEYYFGKAPVDLTLLECAFLSKMLPNPIARHKYYLAGGLDEAWRAVLERVVTKMYERGFITEEEWNEAMASEFHFHYPDEEEASDAGDVDGAIDAG